MKQAPKQSEKQSKAEKEEVKTASESQDKIFLSVISKFDIKT